MKPRWLAWLGLMAMGCTSTSTSTSGRAPNEPSETPSSVSKQVTPQDLSYHRVATLQARVQALSTPQIASADGRALVLRLARAQTCLSVHTESPQLAHATVNLLDAYEALLVEQHGKLRRHVLRSIASAKQDAQLVTLPEPTAVSESCLRNTRLRRTSIARSSYANTMKNAWGIDVPRGYRGRNRVPGGVVR